MGSGFSSNNHGAERVTTRRNGKIMRSRKKLPVEIQYAGQAGISIECKNAVMRFFQFGDRISRARILTHKNSHCLLLTVNDDTVAIKSGFASGYSGEGPRAFSFVLGLLKSYGTELVEYAVSEGLLERLDQSALTMSDMDDIENAKPVRPSRWPDYVFEEDWQSEKSRAFWQNFPSVIPFSIIDVRIIDLAMTFFEHPDQNLITGYRRLEDIVRKRVGSKEHGSKLFSQVFLSQIPKLGWDVLDSNEQKGLAGLFINAYMAHRNPRAHRELEKQKDKLLCEFLLLNHLYLLEGQAFDLPIDSTGDQSQGL